MTSIIQAISEACQLIGKSSPSARIDSETLLCHVMGCNTAHLAAWPDKALSETEAAQFHELVQRRTTGTPIAHLTGEKEFWSLALKVTEDTLIPRPETELLIETVLEKFQENESLDIADLGTGSGAIAIALANSKPGWSLTATDISDKALNVARDNAETHGISNIKFVTSNWFDALSDSRFDIIISNPPYIADADTHLSEGDLRFEPLDALASGTDGMDDIRKITNNAIEHLSDGGWLFLEHGYDQKELVFDCLQGSGFTRISQEHDLADNPRLSFGQFRHTR